MPRPTPLLILLALLSLSACSLFFDSDPGTSGESAESNNISDDVGGDDAGGDDDAGNNDDADNNGGDDSGLPSDAELDTPDEDNFDALPPEDVADDASLGDEDADGRCDPQRTEACAVVRGAIARCRKPDNECRYECEAGLSPSGGDPANGCYCVPSESPDGICDTIDNSCVDQPSCCQDREYLHLLHGADRPADLNIATDNNALAVAWIQKTGDAGANPVRFNLVNTQGQILAQPTVDGLARELELVQDGMGFALAYIDGAIPPSLNVQFYERSDHQPGNRIALSAGMSMVPAHLHATSGTNGRVLVAWSLLDQAPMGEATGCPAQHDQCIQVMAVNRTHEGAAPVTAIAGNTASGLTLSRPFLSYNGTNTIIAYVETSNTSVHAIKTGPLNDSLEPYTAFNTATASFDGRRMELVPMTEGFLLAYTGGEPRTLFLQRLTTTGALLGGPVPVGNDLDNRDPIAPRLLPDGLNRAAVLWAEPSTSQLHFARINENLTTESSSSPQLPPIELIDGDSLEIGWYNGHMAVAMARKVGDDNRVLLGLLSLEGGTPQCAFPTLQFSR